MMPRWSKILSSHASLDELGNGLSWCVIERLERTPRGKLWRKVLGGIPAESAVVTESGRRYTHPRSHEQNGANGVARSGLSRLARLRKVEADGFRASRVRNFLASFNHNKSLPSNCVSAGIEEESENVRLLTAWASERQGLLADIRFSHILLDYFRNSSPSL